VAEAEWNCKDVASMVFNLSHYQLFRTKRQRGKIGEVKIKKQEI